MTIQRLIGAGMLLALLMLAKVAGASETLLTQRQAAQLADVAEQLLAIKYMPCTGGVRTVSLHDGVVKVLCGYTEAYEINFDANVSVVRVAYEH